MTSKEVKPAKRPKIEDKVNKEFEEFIYDDTDYYKRDAQDTKINKPKPKSNKSVPFEKGMFYL